jgi:hypothetical protein
LVVASVTNEFSKGQTNDSLAKQCPVPNNNPAIESSLQLHIPTIATSIWHEVFDNYLSRHPFMNVLNTTSVSENSTMTAPLTLSYYSTLTILLLPCNYDVPANQTAVHTNFMLQLIIASKRWVLYAHHIFDDAAHLVSVSEGAQDLDQASMCKESFKLIDASNAEGVQASPNIQTYCHVKLAALRLQRNKDFHFIVE